MNDRVQYPLVVRPAVEDDISAIARIYAHHVRHGTGSFEVDPPDEAEMRKRFAAICASGHPWLCAQRESAVLGYAYAGPYRPRYAYRFTVEDSVYVAPNALGLGVGRELLRQLIEACAARGYRQMIAVIGDSANIASIALHQRAGFAPAGRLADVGNKFNRWLDIVLMQLALGEGARSPPTQSAGEETR